MKNAAKFLAKIMLLALLMTSIISLSSCTKNEKIPKPEDTNLEYWLLDKLNKKEMTELSNSHWLDDKKYLDSRCEATVDENGNITEPEKCIVYTVGNYPLYDIGVKRITSIKITDPDICVWGLTINSSSDEIISTMEMHGFTKYHSDNESLTVRNGNYRVIVRYNKSIEIYYDMTSILEQILVFGYGK